MIDPGLGRVCRIWAIAQKSGTDVVPFQVDFRNAIGWVDGQQWMLTEIGAYTNGNETNGNLTAAVGTQQVGTALLPFGQLGFDSAGTPGAGYSRSAAVEFRQRLPIDWDGVLGLTPQIRLGADLQPPSPASGWATAGTPVVWVAVQRLRRRV